MANSQDILKVQKEIGEKIKKQFEAYSNIPSERKNETYLKERLELLKIHWQNFQANNDKLISLNEIPMTHDYFKSSYMQQIEAAYNAYHSEIVELWNVMEQYRKQQQEKASNTGENEEPQGEVIDKAILFKAASMMNDKQNSQVGAENLKLIIAQLRAMIDDYFNNESIFSAAQSAAKRRIIISKWKLASEIHSEMMYNPTYEMAPYDDLEEEIQSIMVVEMENEQSNEKSIKSESSAKLPKLSMPTFEGDYIKWFSFKQMFERMVGKQKNLSPLEKLAYLRGQLSDSVKRKIESLPLIDESYETAWSILDETYNDNHIILKKLLDRILGGEKMNGNSVQHMKEVYDSMQEATMAIDNLNINDGYLLKYIFYYGAEKRIDAKSLTLFEQTITSVGEWRSFEPLMKFMNLRIHHLTCKYQLNDQDKPKRSYFESSNNKRTSIALVASSSGGNDLCDCSEKHKLYHCPIFIKSSVEDRIKITRKLNKCLNCFKTGHMASKCSKGKCQKCKKAHNTMLHLELKSKKSALVSQYHTMTQHVFLATVILDIIDKNGSPVKARALLDSAAQLNLLTAKMQRTLGLTYKRTNIELLGVGESTTKLKHRVIINLKSRSSNYTSNLEVHIIKTVTSQQPEKQIDIQNWNMPENLQLADERFNVPADVDLLIGGELFFQLLSEGRISLGEGLPDLQNTVFGWAVVGKLLGLTQQKPYVGVIAEQKLNENLEKFWKIEEKNVMEKSLTKAEMDCETFFENTTKRNKLNGKFIVNLQFLQHPGVLGNSMKMAIRRFQHLERRFKNDPEMHSDYAAFMKEYETLGHMAQIDRKTIERENYFIPHHAVRNPSSSTTKFRVVFDASAKTTSNKSLNEILANGPMLQDELFLIMVRFRLNVYALAADITKMYRQVEVTKADRKWQMIVWRENEAEELKYYMLNTLTYGTTCASYLAIKCLQTLANKNKDKYPLAAAAALRDFNVDDLMSGANTLKEAKELQQQMIAICQQGHMHLHKWCSNHQELLNDIPENKREISLDMTDDKQETKALGIKWIPKDDIFKLSYNPDCHEKVTKRTVVSEASQLFDPLGVVNPVIVTAKIFIQDLWKMKLDWDTELSKELQMKWIKFREGLELLNQLEFPRHIIVKNPTFLQLHAFSDASEKAYGTCVYLRSENEEGEIQCHLVCSKSRVAPTSTLTLPRLELCAATIMTELSKKLKDKMNLEIQEMMFWTDSELVLSWILNEQSYKTFVKNRVAEINRNTHYNQWNYIETKLNPADLVSRGISPEEILNSKLWWHGPPFLTTNQQNWPKLKAQFVRLPDEEKPMKTVLVAQAQEENFIYQINHKNSWTMLQRIIAYAMRWRPKNSSKGENLMESEMEKAERYILKSVQQEAFKAELELIKKGKGSSTKYSSLTPFIDENGLIRVGGRLQKANIEFDHKHPILLPKNHFVTELIAQHIHERNKHAGSQALLAFIRQRYWPESGKTLTNHILKRCIVCVRSKPILLQQIMGNLPEDRVCIARAFVHISLDFFGPIYIRSKKRGVSTIKSYACVFTCLTTKAVHIEAAPDVSIDVFIGCLKRFMARRSAPKKIICDNATNFRGTHNQLMELYEMLQTTENQKVIETCCEDNRIQWKFAPARSPHFNGLSEAAVKSAKTHLKKILNSTQLTYDELTTVLTEIEAILNSRPLTPLSNDPNDLQPITAGHFLVGGPMNSIDDRAIPYSSKTKVWHKLVAIRNEFWDRWANEYLSQLQEKAKWRTERDNITVGTMVMIKKDDLPPMKWRIGRVVGTSQDENGNVRVVQIKTAKADASGTVNKRTKQCDTEKIKLKTKIITRAIHLICPLPVEENTYIKTNKNEAETELKESSMDEEQLAPEPIAKRTRARKLPNTLLIALIGVMLLGGAMCKKCEYKEFKDQPGLYFEKMGKMATTHDEWNLICVLKLEQVWAQIGAIGQILERLDEICNTMETQTNCDITRRQLRQQTNSINSQMKILNGFSHNTVMRKRRDWRNGDKTVPQLHSRTKRGWANFIGTGFEIVTGVMSNSDRERIDGQMETLNGTYQNVMKLIERQTSIQDITQNIIKRDEINVSTQLNNVHSKLKYLKNITITSIEFENLAIQTLAIIESHRERVNTIVDILTQFHHGRISPILLTPDNLKMNLESIAKNIDKNSMIPSDGIHYNLANIYGILQAKISTKRSSIVVQISIPLIQRQFYDILHIIPLPYQHDETSMKIISTEAQYIGINEKQDRYYLMSETEKVACKAFSDELLICKLMHKLYNTNEQQLGCEMAIYTHESKEISPKCVLVDVANTQVWSKLHTPNHYLFSLANATTMNMICVNESTTCTIQGSGIMYISPGCAISSQNYEILAENTMQRQIEIIVPSLNLSRILQRNKLETSLTESTENTTSDVEMDNLIAAIQQQKDSIHVMPRISHHVHHYTLIYILIIVALIGGSWFAWKLTKIINVTKELQVIRSISNPIPKPPRTDHNTDGQVSFK